MTAPDYKSIASKEAGPLHTEFVKWIKKHTGYATDLDSVVLALRLHPHFRTTEDYAKIRDEMRVERQAAEAAAHQRGLQRAQERLDKLRAEQAALEARIRGEAAPEAAPSPAPTKPKRARKPAAKAEAPKPAAKGLRGRSAKAAAKAAEDGSVTEIGRARTRRERPAAAAVVTHADDDEF